MKERLWGKVVRRVAQLQAKGYQSTCSNTRKFMCNLLLRKSDERRFSQAGGRISQCLAGEQRQERSCSDLVSHERIRFPEWLESPKSIKTFRARLAYTSKWLVDARRRKSCALSLFQNNHKKSLHFRV